jgi:CheY-like chemotaxis protein
MSTTASADAGTDPASLVMPLPGVLRILVVDDHAESVEPLARLLAMHGHAVSTAASADEALGEARARRVDLLLSDLDMPVTDGCELLRRIRALYPVRGIAISAHTGKSFAREASAAGYERVLIKPLCFDEVLAAISRISPPA